MSSDTFESDLEHFKKTFQKEFTSSLIKKFIFLSFLIDFGHSFHVKFHPHFYPAGIESRNTFSKIVIRKGGVNNIDKL